MKLHLVLHGLVPTGNMLGGSITWLVIDDGGGVCRSTFHQ
jgi:hypothetical protein